MERVVSLCIRFKKPLAVVLLLVFTASAVQLGTVAFDSPLAASATSWYKKKPTDPKPDPTPPPTSCKNPGDTKFFDDPFLYRDLFPGTSNNAIHYDSTTAQKVCEWYGFSRVANMTKSSPGYGNRNYYTSCGDNTLGYWENGKFVIKPACKSNRWIGTLTCADPINICQQKTKFEITKVAEGTQFFAGGKISYVINARNSGQGTATNVRFVDNIPAGLTYIPQESSPECTQAGNIITCSVGTLTQNQSRQVRLTFQIAQNFACNTTLMNQADIHGDNAESNWSKAMTQIQCNTSDVSVEKTGPSTVVAGSVVVYSVTAKNNGPSVASNVSITDQIPAGLTFNAGQSSQNCSQNGSAVVCNNFTLNPNESRTFQIAFNVPNQNPDHCYPSKIYNKATITTSTNDPNQGNNQSTTVTTNVTCPPPLQADLSIQKSGMSSVVAGGVAVYTVSVFNAGPATAENVRINDPIPSGLSFNPQQSSPECTQQGANVVCAGFNLNANQSKTVTIAFNVPARDPNQCFPDSISNRATVTADRTDPNMGNNTSTVVLTNVTCPPPLGADLSIQKSGPSTVVAGNVVVYTVTASNAGPATATNVTIADPIPAGLTFNAAQSSTNCVQNGANILCNNFSLTSGQSRSFQIAFNVPASNPDQCQPTTIQNKASVSTSQTDPNPSNNQSTIVTTNVTCPPPQGADVSIVKTGPAQIQAGQTIVYNITATNAGPATATNVTVADQIPSGLTFNAAQSSTNCIQNGANILCNNFSLTAGQSRTFQVAFNIPAADPNNCQPTTIQNRASVSTSQTDPNPSNNQSTVVTTNVTCPPPQGADLSIVKSGPATVVAGNVVVYTLTATNAGPATATNIHIIDVIPAGLTFNAAQSSTNCVQDGANILCNNFSLTAGQSRTVQVAFNVPTVDPNQCNPRTIYNQAFVNTSQTDPNPSNNQSTLVSTLVTCPPPVGADLSIVKSGPASVLAGNVIVYTLTATNAGPAVATNVTIADLIPTGLTFNSAQSDSNCIQNGASILCNNFSLQPGQSRTVNVAFNIPAANPNQCAPSQIQNRASVSTSQTDPNPSNNQSTIVTTNVTCPPPQGADVSIVKSGPATVQAGQTIVYTLTASNGGPATATNVNILDPIPAGVTFNAAQSDPSCVQNGNNIVCNNFSLTAGQSRSVQIAFNTPASTGDQCIARVITNQASVNTSQTDPVPSNNQSAIIYTAVQCPPPSNADLMIVKSGPNSILAGSTVVYTVSVTNFGPATATSFTITDPIPTGLTFNAAQSDTICSMNGANVICNGTSLAAGQTKTVNIAFNVPSANPEQCNPTTIQNRASVTSTQDQNTTNNQSQTVFTLVNCPPPTTADLSIVKYGPSSIQAGTTISYTLIATNAGPATALNVTIADPIPTGLTFNAAQSDPSCVQNGVNILCNNFSLTAGQSKSVTIAFNVPAKDPNQCQPTTIQNKASVSTSQTDPNPSNNQSQIVFTTVNCPQSTTADLSITKSGPANVTASGVIVYSLTATNAGPATATNVTIADPIPTGLTFNAAQSDPRCVQNGVNILCNNFSLTAGQSKTVAIAFNLPVVNPNQCQPTTIQNRASVSTSVTDPNPANNQSQTVFTVVNCPPPTTADLSITKTGPSSVPHGGVVKYSLTATNAGPATATNVTIADPIPTGLTFNAAESDPSCIQNGVNILCNNFSLTPGQSKTVTVAFNVPAVNPNQCTQGLIQNRASVSTSATDPNPTNNQSQLVTTLVTCPPPTNADLSIQKSGPAVITISGSDSIEYTVIATNFGPASASGVTITDPIPSGLVFNPSKSDAGCVQNGNNVLCSNIQLPAGVSRSFKLTFDIPFVAQCTARTITNQATIGSNAQPDNNQTNNQSQVVSTNVQCQVINADLSISKSGPASVVAGGVITYTITAMNAGPANVDQVTITDNIPSGLTFNPTFSDASCTQNGNQITCPLSLTAGQLRTFQLAFTVPFTASCNTQVVNVAQITGNKADPNQGNNQSNSVSTNVLCANPTFNISKTDNKTTAAPGETLTYSITVTNTSAFTANNVNIIDTLPSNVTFQNASDNGVTGTGNTIRWNGLTFTAGQTRTLTLTVRINDGTAHNTVLSNIVSVNGTTATDTTTVQVVQQFGCIDITKEVLDQNNNFVNPVPSFTFRLDNNQTVTSDSAGHAKFTNVSVGSHSVTEDLPSGYTQLSVLPSSTITVNAGTSCATIVFKNRQSTTGNATFTISKTDGRTSAYAGDQLQYTITVTNTSSVNATNQTIVDILPQYVTFVSASDGGINNGSTVTWNNVSLTAGQSRTFTLTVTISHSAPNGAVLTNVAQIGSQFATDATSVMTQYEPPVYPPVYPPVQPPIYPPPPPPTTFKPYPYPIPVTGHTGDNDTYYASADTVDAYITEPTDGNGETNFIAYVSILVTTIAGLASAAGGAAMRMF